VNKLISALLFLLIPALSAFSNLNETVQFDNYAHFFVENKGQWAPEVQYLAKIQGMNAWITDHGVVYDYYKIGHNYSEAELFNMPEHEKLEYRRNNSKIKGHVIKTIFKNSNQSQNFIGQYPLETYYNFLLGDDKSKWVGKIPLYEVATIENLYQGIDIKYYFDGGLLRYDFIVRPGADISPISIEMEGIEQYSVNNNGELELETSLGRISHKDIVAFQKTANGDNEIIETRFIQKENGAIGFTVEQYDRQKELIIDPLVYSTFLGETAEEFGNEIVLDNARNVYIIGSTNSISYPVITGAYDETHNGNFDVFVSKLTAEGNELEYSTFLGGSSLDYGYDISIDNSGDVYLTGMTYSADYPVTNGAYDEIYNGGSTLHKEGDVFVSKLNSSGDQLEYSTYIGGSDRDEGNAIDVDAGKNVYLTGSTKSLNYPVTSGAYDESHNIFNGSSDDVFVSKLNATGTQLEFSTYLGGTKGDRGNGIAIDNSGNVYVTGATGSANFPKTDGTYFDGSERGVFVSKFNSSGTQLVYSTYFGGTSIGQAITIDNTGKAHIAGYTSSSSYPTTIGAFDQSYNGGSYDAFVSGLDINGTNIEYSTFLGGNADDKAEGIVIDDKGQLIVIGSTRSVNFPVTSGAYDENHNDLGSNYDVFISRLDTTGTLLKYSTFLGGEYSDLGSGIALDNSGSVYAVGRTSSTNYPVTVGVYDESHNGSHDAFVTKLIPQRPLLITSPIGNEKLQAQSIYNITWEAVYVNNVKIEYSTNNGSTWTGIVNSIPAADQSYQWTVPDSISTRCKLRITDTENPAYNDDSDDTFTIYIRFEVLSPLNGEKWQAGTPKKISWTGDNGSDVNIEFSNDNGTSWQKIVTTNAAQGNYTWSVPDVSFDECKIRLSDPGLTTNNSVSETFKIVKLNLTYPAEGTKLDISSVAVIAWESSLINNVKIEYSTDNGSNWAEIISSITASSETYNWVVPNNPSAECKIRVSDTSDTTVTSESSGVFTIFLNDIFARFVMDSVITQAPCYVNVMFHSVGLNYRGIENLLLYDFEAREDGVVVSQAESRLQVGGIDQIALDLKTVLLLDNSTSVQPNLPEIKNAAIALINNKLPTQEIAIYVFSENPVLIQDFTTDSLALINAVNSIKTGFPTTNLYGSILAALPTWQDSVSLELIKQGFLVLLTDGDDTQGSSTLKQVMDARGEKKIYAVGLGNDLNSETLNQIGNAGTFIIPDINDLTAKFIEIQEDLIAFTNSFYRLNYVSPKRGNFEHTLKISLKENLNSGSDSYLQTSFNSNGFFSVYYGITVGATVENPFGIDTLSMSPNGTSIVEIESPFTFGHEGYVFTPSDPEKIKIEQLLANEIEYELTASGNSNDLLSLQIDDPVNSYTKTLMINFDQPLEIDQSKTFLNTYSMQQNYPNPFNPTTSIEFNLPKPEFVELRIYNLLGKEVATLVSNKLNSGKHTFKFDGQNLASSVYYYQIKAGEFQQVRKMILMK